MVSVKLFAISVLFGELVNVFFQIVVVRVGTTTPGPIATLSSRVGLYFVLFCFFGWSFWMELSSDDGWGMTLRRMMMWLMCVVL